MKKDKKMLSCPNCKSSNVTLQKKNIQKEFNDDSSQEKNIIKTEPIVYECTCQDCNYKYDVNVGYRNYFICANPMPVDESKKVKLLATYNSDSPLEKDYKIISVQTDSNNKSEVTYLLLLKEEDFPKVISKETLEEVKQEPPKVFSLHK